MFQMHRMMSLIFWLHIIVMVSSKLEVSNLALINPKYQDEDLKDIPYSIANFGFAPFGKTMIGHLQTAPALDKQCVPDSDAEQNANIQNSFLLIPRGECPFVTKAIHAQQMGAKMAIIMDNQDHEGQVIMKDNGYGYKVTIPSIFINYQMGQKLLQLLKITQNKVSLRISFDNNKTKKADVVLYMQAMNRLGYYFVQQFKPFYYKIEKYLNMTIVYEVISCSICNPQDCYDGKKYCSISYGHENGATGKMVLDQQLREQTMYYKHTEQWWSYMKCISDECNKVSEIEQCSNKCLVRSNVSPSILLNQTSSTFSNPEQSALHVTNLDRMKNSGVQTFPAISINGIMIRGSLSAEFVFDDICNTLISPPKQCEQYVNYEQNVTTSDKTYWVVVVLVLIGCTLLFSALFIVCRRRMRKRMSQGMKEEVDDMVNKYIEFYSQRSGRK